MEHILNRSIPLNEEYDVIVCGGGPSGCTAAASAAREGAKTLLLEGTAVLGGMATNGLVNAFTTMTDGINMIYSGMANKVINEMKQYMPHIPLDDYKNPPIDFERLKKIYDDLVVESGADVLLCSTVAGIEMKDDRNIDLILVANKAGLTAYRAKVYIDCTGDADLYAWAGKEYIKGDERGDLMAASMCYIVSNVDEYQFPFMEKQYGGKHRDTIKAIIASGKYDIPDNHYVAKKIGPRTYAFNAGHLWDVDATDPKSVTEGCIRGRRLARELHNGFKEFAPASFAGSYLSLTSPSLGIRETRRIIGDYTFKADDYVARASFPDEIYRGNYNIDVHCRPGSGGASDADRKRAQEQKGKDLGARWGRYGVGESYGVPYRCYCPRDLDNVLVAGRSVSSERVANGTLRIMPACMSAGEAVGMAAKFACEMDEINIHKIDTQRLRKRLIEEGTYLPKQETDTF